MFESVQKSFSFTCIFCIEIEFTSFVYGWLVTKDKHNENGTYVCCFSSCQPVIEKDTSGAWAMLSKSFSFDLCLCVCVFAFINSASPAMPKRGWYPPHLMWIIYIHSKCMRQVEETRRNINEIDVEWDNVVWMWLWIVKNAIDLTPKVFLHRRRHYSFKFVRSRSRLVECSFDLCFCSLILVTLFYCVHGKWMRTKCIDEMKLLLRY